MYPLKQPQFQWIGRHLGIYRPVRLTSFCNGNGNQSCLMKLLELFEKVNRHVDAEKTMNIIYPDFRRHLFIFAEVPSTFHHVPQVEELLSHPLCKSHPMVWQCVKESVRIQRMAGNSHNFSHFRWQCLITGPHSCPSISRRIPWSECIFL